MKLQSCDNCGVVLDMDKVPFHNDMYLYDEVTGGEVIDERYAQYNQATGNWTRFVPCSVCNEPVFEEV
jgi:hypothetical protein